MRSLTTFFALVLLLGALGSVSQAQSNDAAGQNAKPAAASASKQEVEELRGEVAAQKRTIEELKAMVQKLVDAQARPTANGSAQAKPVSATSPDLSAANGAAGDGAHLVNTVLVQPDPILAALAADQAAPKKVDAPVTAGWNGEHFFIKSSDGQFQLQPYGYFQSDYRSYTGDGAPPNTFLIRRARFGFQGNYGKRYTFAVLADAAATNGLILRDLYINAQIKPEFQVQIGQFKEPFAQETLIGATNLDFVERSLASILYPSAATSYRSPGMTLHGDIDGGVVQWWAGAFNGKGILANNTTNQPEIIGRLRFYPWRKHKDSMLQGLAFGGSVGAGRTRGLSNENSFSGTLPDAAYTFFPSFRINGPVERYNGELTWVYSRWGVRAEYDQLNQFRRSVGSEQSDNLGFISLPGIVAKAGYGQVTYLLTGETRPENGTPKVKHPFLGPGGDAGGGGRALGAWELAFRYDSIEAHEPGISLLSNPLTPGFVTTYVNHTDEFTFGVNWYLNYWVKYQFNVAVDRLKEPSVTGQVPQDFTVLLNRLQFRF
jgi:phosphate-selective porin